MGPGRLQGHDRVFGSVEEMLAGASEAPGTLW
jgi:hypothetical protein